MLDDSRRTTFVHVETGSTCGRNQYAAALHGGRSAFFAFTEHQGLVVCDGFFNRSTRSDSAYLATFAFIVFFALGGEGGDFVCGQIRQHRGAGWAVLQQLFIVGEDVSVATGGADGVIDVDGFAVGRQEFHLLSQPVTNTKIVRTSERVNHADIGSCGRQDDEVFTFIMQCLYVLASGHSAIEFLNLFQRIAGNNDTADSGFHCWLQNCVGRTNLRFNIATVLLRLK